MSASLFRSSVLTLALLAVCSHPAYSAKTHSAKTSDSASQSQQMEDATRLQIFLDNANFGSGKIDGHGGEFTKKALALYRASMGLPAKDKADAKAAPDISGMDLSSVTPVFTTYTITQEDAETVDDMPSGPVAESKVKWLPYKTLLEAVAEKFHSDPKFIKQLNPDKVDHLKAGDEIKVPNVKPFELSSVKALKPGDYMETVASNELGGDTASSSGDEKSALEKTTAEKKESEQKSEPPLTIHVSTKDSMLEVLAGEKVAAAFPVTVGSEQTASPIGSWTVKAIAKLPNFRYDPKMLKEGKRSSNSHLLPPGPNNPVGVVWIALNKPGIGIHGTDDPDSVGRSASHGCIRLANWDIVKLAAMVKPGMHVTID